MLKILIAVDGSNSSDHAIQHAINLAQSGTQIELHLINVQPALTGDVAAFVGQEALASFHQERGQEESRSARDKLDNAKIAYDLHIEVGAIAEKIAQCAEQLKIDQIIMGSRGMGSIGNLILGSVATKVIHLVNTPVTLVK